jgi:hypothetical protein
MAEASLIPKQNLTAQRDIGGGFNLFFNISLVFFLVSALVSGGLFVYKKSVEGSLTSKRSQLETTLENDFPAKTIADHERVSTAMQISNALISGHIKRYRSEILTLLERNVLPDVTFSSFSFNEKGADLTMTLAGAAASYKTVANQVSVIQGLDEVASAGFSNLSLSAEGLVSFSMKVKLKPPQASSAAGKANSGSTEPTVLIR